MGIIPHNGDFTKESNVNHPPVANKWNKVAVAFDASSQLVQMYVNGNIEEYSTSSSGPHSTYNGQVVIGSWYHFDGVWHDKRALSGSMACVKLWNFYRDLTTYRADTLACQYA